MYMYVLNVLIGDDSYCGGGGIHHENYPVDIRIIRVFFCYTFFV